MNTQQAYARLLRKYQRGDALYYPVLDAKVGDVAYFADGTYQTRFNVFELSQEVFQLSFTAHQAGSYPEGC